MNLPWPSHRFLGCPWSEVDVALRLWARGAALMDMWRFPEMGVPHSYISSISRWDFPLETIIEMGYPHFRKPPYIYIYTLGITGSSLVRYFIYFYLVLCNILLSMEKCTDQQQKMIVCFEIHHLGLWIAINWWMTVDWWLLGLNYLFDWALLISHELGTPLLEAVSKTRTSSHENVIAHLCKFWFVGWW